MKSLLLSLLFLTGCTSVPARNDSTFKQCPDDPERQALRSQELRTLVKEDQDDRTDPIDWIRVLPRDEARRKRIGEIFGEGCFKTVEDYAAAALVYQHGNIPDHFFQTYLWAKKAVELGDSSQKRLMAMGIDRYLVNIGHKQLFATQASKPSTSDCWCLEEVEKGFPEKRRLELAQKSLAEMLQWVDLLNKDQASCNPAKFCAKQFKDSPRGILPGFW
ncbi:MAG: hypothetical protein IPK04_21710 [Bdellovibrionales bacterium]|nr:hypothetical protein [Bdellovibrionales bacterium]